MLRGRDNPAGSGSTSATSSPILRALGPGELLDVVRPLVDASHSLRVRCPAKRRRVRDAEAARAQGQQHLRSGLDAEAADLDVDPPGPEGVRRDEGAPRVAVQWGNCSMSSLAEVVVTRWSRAEQIGLPRPETA